MPQTPAPDTDQPFDLFIIGGGINGAGIARDAAGRGLKTGLCERDDLAQHTSSASTKLIHGGLRYLEHYAFRLVRESLIERERLLESAPHIIWPLRFILPHHKGLRPAWLLRTGLFIYDHLGGRKRLPPTKRADLARPPYAGQLKPEFATAFAYSDCWVEDSRLVALNAVDAHERGCDILTRTECVGLERGAELWTIKLKARDGTLHTVQARALVNAAGPWVDEIETRAEPGRNGGSVRLVKGSHIVVHRLYEGDHAFIFQNTDGRIFFAIPYERDYTLIGTTDMAVDTPGEGAEISQAEIDYLCAGASEYFAKPVTPDRIAWSYSGVRALFDDNTEAASKVTRDYTLNLDTRAAAKLSVLGGKITTFRKLAEHALEKLQPVLPAMSGPWTECAHLPGGDMPDADFEGFLDQLCMAHDGFQRPFLRRLARAYGTRVTDLLGEAKTPADLGRDFGAGLYEREVHYLIEREFVMDAGDVLWRRSKVGLHMSQAQRSALWAWFKTRSETADA